MADNYTHRYNARNALTIAEYTPRNMEAFILGANGPDPLFCYQMYNPFRVHDLSRLGSVMHNEKTALFLKNLFTLARTDAQKDYCLGFLCHYSLDSLIHPYVNYVTEAYGLPFNIPSGHGYFESALDSLISKKVSGQEAARVSYYFPPISRMHLEQIAYLFKIAVDATYPDKVYHASEYVQAFKDFRFIKNFFYSPKKFKFAAALAVEKLFGFKEGYVVSHMQPCKRKIQDIPFWLNSGAGLYCSRSIEDILNQADFMSARNISIGLEFFKGIITADDMMEDVGSKSYETGIAVY